MDDQLQTFLRDAGRHRLLDGPEEKALGRVVQRGIDRPRSTPQHAEAIRARNELVVCNVRLVVSVARYYRNRGLPQADVVQYGLLGLNRAAEKFDPEHGTRFSTYATLWIKQAIQRGLSSGGSAIRLPSTVADVRAKVRGTMLRYPDADIEFIADLLDIPIEDVDRSLNAAEVVTSLDRNIATDDHTHTMLDGMADPHADDPQDVTNDLTDQLRAALDVLPREHRRVIDLLFGLTSGEPMRAEDAAKKIKRDRRPLSTSTVKNLRDEALEFLGHRLGHVDPEALAEALAAWDERKKKRGL